MTKGTVMVNLKRDWFDGQSLYQVRDNPHEFPAEFAEKPKQRKGETDEQFAGRKDDPYDVLPTTAKLLGETRTVTTLQDTANGEQVEVATAVPDEVESVGGALNKEGREDPDQSVSAAAAAAKDAGTQVGGKPRESGPLPAGSQQKK